MKTHLRATAEPGRCSSKGSHELFFSEKPAELAAAQQICGTRPWSRDASRLPSVTVTNGGLGACHLLGWPAYHRRRTRGRPRRSAGLPIEADPGELWEQVKSA